MGCCTTAKKNTHGNQNSGSALPPQPGSGNSPGGNEDIQVIVVFQGQQHQIGTQTAKFVGNLVNELNKKFGVSGHSLWFQDRKLVGTQLGQAGIYNLSELQFIPDSAGSNAGLPPGPAMPFDMNSLQRPPTLMLNNPPPPGQVNNVNVPPPTWNNAPPPGPSSSSAPPPYNPAGNAPPPSSMPSGPGNASAPSIQNFRVRFRQPSGKIIDAAACSTDLIADVKKTYVDPVMGGVPTKIVYANKEIGSMDTFEYAGVTPNAVLNIVLDN